MWLPLERSAGSALPSAEVLPPARLGDALHKGSDLCQPSWKLSLAFGVSTGGGSALTSGAAWHQRVLDRPRGTARAGDGEGATDGWQSPG